MILTTNAITPDTNPYTILNLRKGANDEEIKQAYFEMVKKWDPERHTERFMVIQQAYEKLRDPKRRARGDLFTYNFVKGDFNFTPSEREAADQPPPTQRLSEIEELLRNGQELDAGTRDEAVRLLSGMAFQHFRKKQWREAITALVRTLEIDQTNQRAKGNLNLAYMRLGWSYATNNLIREAIELWEKSLQINPDNTPILHNLAIATEVEGGREKSDRYWAEVLRRWKGALDQEPNNEYIKNLIVETHRHFGGRDLSSNRDGDAAIEEYKEVLKINPDDFEAQLKIAETLMEEKKWGDAVRELRHLAAKNKSNTQILNMLSWALLNNGDIDQAFLNWQRALNMDPKNYTIRESIIKARMDLAKKCRISGQFTPALVHFRRLAQLIPKSPEVHFEIAQTYLAQGDQRLAFRELQIVMQLDPKHRDAKKLISELRLRR